MPTINLYLDDWEDQKLTEAEAVFDHLTRGEIIRMAVDEFLKGNAVKAGYPHFPGHQARMQAAAAAEAQ